ncbi:hypothetical protein KCP69_13730 [Salmonella enterica subsp. enterica]|nr:hypothetical protein KCP69_13730 [Salmonella enterica subsp. enterica]
MNVSTIHRHSLTRGRGNSHWRTLFLAPQPPYAEQSEFTTVSTGCCGG